MHRSATCPLHVMCAGVVTRKLMPVPSAGRRGYVYLGALCRSVAGELGSLAGNVFTDSATAGRDG